MQARGQVLLLLMCVITSLTPAVPVCTQGRPRGVAFSGLDHDAYFQHTVAAYRVWSVECRMSARGVSYPLLIASTWEFLRVAVIQLPEAPRRRFTRAPRSPPQLTIPTAALRSGFRGFPTATWKWKWERASRSCRRGEDRTEGCRSCRSSGTSIFGNVYMSIWYPRVARVLTLGYAPHRSRAVLGSGKTGMQGRGRHKAGTQEVPRTTTADGTRRGVSGETNAYFHHGLYRTSPSVFRLRGWFPCMQLVASGVMVPVIETRRDRKASTSSLYREWGICHACPYRWDGEEGVVQLRIG
ncbi:uncharacterized protein EI97DRAFT_439751 [Westerdykella ornata]|uniref:Uncharacterized protein n=1 Tax=Westerdykella ornata TaxID=318751 RepID=A0A6A6JUG9_WESOR|nr:uncharacterized protein EI97DRAFT_439751 [Westerdykella ornata]KAF2279396.1 hypothetical protein EI97DRAFT_439751 [Westerdykella ornata]